MMQTAAATTLKRKLTSQAIRDPLFRDALDEAAKEIAQHSKNAANEATVEAAFERVLYGVLRDVGIPFHPEKEMPVKTRRHTARGRTDSRIGGVVIEYKQPSTLKTKASQAAAIEQLSLYVESLSESVDNDVVGYLTDGLKVLEIRWNKQGVSTQSSLEELSGVTLARLVKSVVSLEHSALTSSNLIRDFCDKGGTGTIFDLARGLNKTLRDKPTAKTKMLQAEWESMFRLAHDDKSQQQKILDRREALKSLFKIEIDSTDKEYRALFALDTAYAIVLKLISYRVVSDVKFNQVLMDFKSLVDATPDVLKTFVQALEDGDLFRQVGIINLLEGDFFSWYCDDGQWNDFSFRSIQSALSVLARYEDSRSIFDGSHAVDLFRSLYEATVPQKVRSSLGEFYTPFWLAQHVLESSGVEYESSILDPCCGSGTFLIAAIETIRSSWGKNPPKDAANHILTHVYGIDLNPLAVLTARVHYFIHIADLISDSTDQIVIPVFLGDASNVPQRVAIDGVECIQYSLKTLQTPINVSIPVALASDIGVFMTMMNEFEALVKEGDYNSATDYLLRESAKYHGSQSVSDALRQLANDVIELEKKEWNGIWARIIANFVTVASLGKFTNIVGNPPWVDWKSLPSGYREQIKGLCLDRGLFSGAGRTGGINLNICALIAHVSASNWLEDKGVMALLMPKELANQASYEGWRRAVGGMKCSLMALDDWSKSGHPFDPVKEDFMTFRFEARASRRKHVPVRSFQKIRGAGKAHEWPSLERAVQNLSVTNRVASQIIPGATTYVIADNKQELAAMARVAGHCSYKGREGIEFYPQELLLLTYDSAGPKKGTAWMRNIQVGKSKYKIPAQRILLETEYLFPLVKGPNIEFCDIKDSQIYVIFPYEASDPHSPVDRATLRAKCPLLYNYLQRYKSVLEQQTHFSDAMKQNTEFYGLARTGPYSFKSYYVSYRDNSKWHAAVVTSRDTSWGENKRYVFQNHAVSMCERDNGTYIELDEAYYVAGIFNAPVVERFIYAASDNRSFKIRPPVLVPPYDRLNKLHRRIVSLSKSLHDQPSRTDGRLAELERLYLQSCP